MKNGSDLERESESLPKHSEAKKIFFQADEKLFQTYDVKMKTSFKYFLVGSENSLKFE